MRFLLTLLPATLFVGCAEPAPEEALPGVEPGDSAALFLTVGQITLGNVERCFNGKDDDGDGLVDKNDPECKGAGPGGHGISGDVPEGTGIVPDPNERGIKFGDIEAGVVYTARGTEGLKEEYSLLTVRMKGEREETFSYVSITRGEIVAIYPVTLEGDKEPSLLLDVEIDKEIVSYLAQGPIGNAAYTDVGADEIKR